MRQLLFAILLTVVSACSAFAQSSPTVVLPSITYPPFSGSLSPIASNSVLGSLAGGTPSGLAVPSCSAAGSTQINMLIK